MTTSFANRTVFLGCSDKQAQAFDQLHPKKVFSHREVEEALTDYARNLWIVSSSRYLPKIYSACTWPLTHRLESMLVLDNITNDTWTSLSQVTNKLVMIPLHKASLPINELGEVLADDGRSNYAICVSVDLQNRVVTIWRGDITTLLVPLSAFPARPGNPQPNFSKVSIIDYGQTIKFGEYEASMESILYEYDPDYRRLLKRKRCAEEQGFGPSFKRLRIQKGLRRLDFHPLSEKTIARIERGEVKRLHKNTYRILSEKLGVGREEIASY